MRAAAIDIGTNSVKLLIAEVSRTRRLKPLYEEVVITRIGENVSAKRALSDAAMKRTLRTLERFRNLCNRRKVREIHAVATQALRISSNAQAFIAQCRKKLGLRLIILSLREEARLTSLGARSDDKTPEATIIDIGGGSTEVSSSRPHAPFWYISFPIGAVYLTEKFLRHDPPTKQERAKMERFIAQTLLPLSKAKLLTQPLIGVGGTITTLAMMNLAQKQKAISRQKLHHRRLSQAWIRQTYEQMLALPIHRRRQMKGLEPKRADIIIAGTTILLGAMERMNFPALTVSTRGLRHGVLLEKM